MTSDVTLKEKFLRLWHWGPSLALSIISTISLCGINGMFAWWPPFSSTAAFLNFTLYMLWNVLILNNFFNAAFDGPGHVPNGWKPKDDRDKEFLQYCTFCKGYKAPRSHHCRKCEKCVMKMDHHCPWINNCVGHANHASFTYFLFFAPCGCLHSLLILIPTLYRALNRHYYLLYRTPDVPLVILSVRQFVVSLLATSLAIGVILAVGGLCFIQVRSILKNETGIESWIIEKARYREKEEDEEETFVFPYNLGRWKNWLQVFSWDMSLSRGRDGIWWTVKEGCDQYTLTIEQIKQKIEKKDRSVLHWIIEDYSGAIFPITKGPRTCCRPPFSDEPRIPLKMEDKVMVTRWKKHWLYGDKVLDSPKSSGESSADENARSRRVRGWFPRRCAVEMIEDANGSDFPPPSPHTDKKKDK